MKLLALFFLLPLLLPTSLLGQAYTADKVVVYKKPAQGKPLSLHIYHPKNPTKKKLPCIVFFFGGGWQGGNPKQFFQQADYFKRRGIVAISAEYRTKKSHKTSPDACVMDAKSAIRWTRQHAEELGIDPDKIIASGGSAGGHIAACTGVLDGLESPGEDLSISSRPNAMVLFNPVLDTTVKGYGANRFKVDKTVLSPCHHIKKGIPPTLIFHGTKDTTVPYENAQRFEKLMKAAGNQCELYPFQDRNHGFFNGSFFRKNNTDDDYATTMHEADRFLTQLGIIPGKPLPLKQAAVKSNSDAAAPPQKVQKQAPEGKIIRVTCVGDSNTQRGYPKTLEKMLGKGWKTTNCGIGAATIIDGTLRPYHTLKEYRSALASKPDYVLIMLGTNDANPRFWGAKRETDFKGSDAEEFKSRYLNLIKNLQGLESKPKILIILPLPIFPDLSKNPENAQGRKDNLNQFIIPLIKEVAKEKNLPVIDIHSLLANSKNLCADGVHYKAQGYQKMCAAFKKALLTEAKK